MSDESPEDAPCLSEKEPSILLVEDHPRMRDVLVGIIHQQSDWKVQETAGNGREAVQMAEKIHPDVVVMDVSMPELNGIQAVQQIKQNHPSTKMLMVSNYAGKEIVLAALKQGASGYISKQHAFEELVPAIRTVLSGQPYFCKKISLMMNT